MDESKGTEIIQEVIKPVQQSLQEALLGIVKSTGEAKDFLLSEFPEVFQQLLLWKLVLHSISFIFSFIFVGVVIYFYIKIMHPFFIKNTKEARHDVVGAKVAHGLVSVLLPVVTALLFMHIYNLQWLQILIAPKVYVLEYIKNYF